MCVCMCVCVFACICIYCVDTICYNACAGDDSPLYRKVLEQDVIPHARKMNDQVMHACIHIS